MSEENKKRSKSFVLRIDSIIMDEIEKWAADEFRSTNAQIMYILDDALKKKRRKSEKKNKDN